MTSSVNNDNINSALSQNIFSNSNESKNSNSKKKEQPPKETFYNLCQALLRFINRKIVKKYIYPNEAQLPKEKRGLELRTNNEWKYYLNENVSEEEKIRDVFKDDLFLSSLQKMAKALNEVVDYIDLNQKKISMIEERSRNKEERNNSLTELRNLIDNYFENKDKDKRDNLDINKSENEDGTLKNINDKIKEKINELYSLQKYIDGVAENNNMSNENCEKNDESTIKEEIIPLINNSELSNKNSKSSEKKEIDILIQNFRLDKIIESGKSKEKVMQDKKEEIKNEHIYLNKKTERESKTKTGKNKNKKKKNQKKELENTENDINTNEAKEKEINKNNYPPIKLQTIPILKPRENNININNIEIKERKKDEDIEEEILQELLNEERENSNNVDNNKKDEKKEVINIDSLTNNKTTEEIFESELKRHFSENQRNKKNKKSIILKSLIFSIDDKKILNIKKYNDRITGPFLAGSYKAFRDLYLIDYPREIDIIYKYKNMLLNKEAIDFSVKEVLENYLELNIIKNNEIAENENKVTKIEVECINKNWGNDSIKFNVLFVDCEHEYNDKIIDELIFNKKEFLVKTEEEKFVNVCLFLRLWRRKNNFYYLIPEVLDEIVRKYLSNGQSVLIIVLNVFYELFNKMPEFYPERKDDFISKQLLLCQDIMDNFFSKDNYEKIDELKKNLIKQVEDINSKKFDELFKM